MKFTQSRLREKVSTGERVAEEEKLEHKAADSAIRVLKNIQQSQSDSSGRGGLCFNLGSGG